MLTVLPALEYVAVEFCIATSTAQLLPGILGRNASIPILLGDPAEAVKAGLAAHVPLNLHQNMRVAFWFDVMAVSAFHVWPPVVDIVCVDVADREEHIRITKSPSIRFETGTTAAGLLMFVPPSTGL